MFHVFNVFNLFLCCNLAVGLQCICFNKPIIIIIIIIAHGHKHRDRPGRDSKPHSDIHLNLHPMHYTAWPRHPNISIFRKESL